MPRITTLHNVMWEKYECIYVFLVQIYVHNKLIVSNFFLEIHGILKDIFTVNINRNPIIVQHAVNF